ncbi:hypothetical protein L6164_021265 [Bauhinia variegata]|uniref:Uncharacterized protein n=1 Tax=Bauhinia variegata TaxID=167791 RepID=A0ACB9N3A6_BAUVA|nr:hypothetical protein L6164_021265 [Bauhinia variegata]
MDPGEIYGEHLERLNPAKPDSLANFQGRDTMKLFNWVHKRFHHSTLKDGFTSSMQKTEPEMKNVDSQALLKQVELGDLLGGWNDGILTIGTLGYDSVKAFDQQKVYSFETEDDLDEGEGEHSLVDGDEEDNYDDEQEELNPLMHTTFEDNYEDVVNANPDVNAITEEMVGNMNEILLTPPVMFHEVTEISDGETDQKRKKGERITLADLFLADSDVKMKLDPAKAWLESSEISTLKAKHGLSFAKKLIPHVKEKSRPIKNIQKLMKKMLKRKIHPEFDVKNEKPEGEESCAAGIIENHKHGANDSISLLPIQGITV